MIDTAGQPERHMDPKRHLKTCLMCESPINITAKFCSACGYKLNSVTSVAKPSVAAKWYHNIWIVLFLLFFVLGPFGLPLVWKNPRFSQGIKLALTAIMMLYMVFLTALIVRMVQTITAHMQQFNSILQGY